MRVMKARFTLVRTRILTKIGVLLPPLYAYMAQVVKEGENIFFVKFFIKDKIFRPTAKIELHLDISPAHKNNGTSNISDMLTGYARASGFECKIKPDAWASQSVADKHSK